MLDGCLRDGGHETERLAKGKSPGTPDVRGSASGRLPYRSVHRPPRHAGTAESSVCQPSLGPVRLLDFGVDNRGDGRAARAREPRGGEVVRRELELRAEEAVVTRGRAWRRNL